MINFKEFSESFENQIDNLFTETKSSLSNIGSSRSFGDRIEDTITNSWESIVKNLGFLPINSPGRRTIFDFACKSTDNAFFGFDIKTKDLDSAKYSDGGVCAVGNLLKFLVNDKGNFIIVEFGHNKAKEGTDFRDLEYIRICPFHLLPLDIYRIENLGTGQVRLNYSLNQVWDEINWERPIVEFYDYFSELSINHYKRVKSDADKRIKSIEAFKDSNYQHFKFVK